MALLPLLLDLLLKTTKPLGLLLTSSELIDKNLFVVQLDGHDLVRPFSRLDDFSLHAFLFELEQRNSVFDLLFVVGEAFQSHIGLETKCLSCLGRGVCTLVLDTPSE